MLPFSLLQKHQLQDSLLLPALAYGFRDFGDTFLFPTLELRFSPLFSDSLLSIIPSTQTHRSNGTPQNVSSKLLRELQDDCLTISESELGESDSATICKFITTYSKLLRSRLKSIHLVRTDLSKVKRKKVRSKVDGKYVDLFREESALTSDHGRLLKVILSLTAGCEILESFYILSINFPTEWFETLGEALRACKSENFRIFGLKNVYMGDEGMKIITPFLSQSNFKVIHLENCGLTDRSTVYFVGLIKAQEALMDTLFWNCTLRLDTRRGRIRFGLFYPRILLSLSFFFNCR